MITSNQNTKIQIVRALIQQSKERKNSGLFVVEGVRLVDEVFQTNWQIEYILFSENLSLRGLDILEQARTKNISVDEIPSSLMKKIADTEHPQGILCVVHQTQLPIPQNLNFLLICDSVSDPGNLGTILRSADAAKVQAVLIAPNSTDVYSPKVVRAGMGAHFHIPIHQTSWPEISKICKNTNYSLNVHLASADANLSCWEVDLTQPIAIIVGSEANGPGLEAQEFADSKIKIPMPGSSESLNAAIATSILLFEIVRQRLK
ncbi:MAG: RNA methyltransferase [Anaerolineaceae bacterium]|nr:RNA methyltransferase [Anaerolineaceae bacterium]